MINLLLLHCLRVNERFFGPDRSIIPYFLFLLVIGCFRQHGFLVSSCNCIMFSRWKKTIGSSSFPRPVKPVPPDWPSLTHCCCSFPKWAFFKRKKRTEGFGHPAWSVLQLCSWFRVGGFQLSAGRKAAAKPFSTVSKTFCNLDCYRLQSRPV